jgi:hypothetical protein
MRKLEMFLQYCVTGSDESTIAEYHRRLSRTDIVLRTVGKALETATAQDFTDLIRQMSRAGVPGNRLGVVVHTLQVFRKRTGGADWQMIEAPAR